MTMDCVPINSMIINKELREGDRQTVGIGEVGDPLPTIQAAHHHAVAIRGGGGTMSESADVLVLQMRDGKPGGGKGPLVEWRNVMPCVDTGVTRMMVAVLPEVANSLVRRHDGSPNPDKKQGANVVVVSLDPLGSNSMKSANPNSGSHITEVAKCIDTTNPDPTKNQGGMVICLTPWNCESKRVYDPKGATPTLPSGTKEGANIQPAVLCYPLDMDKLKPSNNTEEAFMRGERKGGNGFGVGSADDPAYTVNTVDRHAVAYGIVEGAHGVTLQPETVVTAQGQGGKPGQGYQAVVEKSRAYGIVEGGYSVSLQNESAATIQVGGGHPGQGCNAVLILAPCIVRRLLPVECERLMGFPDGHTIPLGLDPDNPATVAEFKRIHNEYRAIISATTMAKPKPKTDKQVRNWLVRIVNPDTCPDAPRYKADGNSMCTNCMEWIGRRLDAVVREDAEVAS